MAKTDLDTLIQKRRLLNQRIAKANGQRWREKKRSILPTLQDLRELLSYDPDTGIFTWLVDRNSFHGKVKKGAIAGTLKLGKAGGYIMICVDQRLYPAHRLAYWFMKGEPAPKGIDVEHENRNRADNKWSNLRLANATQRRDNTTGFKGVHRVSGNNKWFARITINRKIIHLGCFDTPEAAAEARRAAEVKYHGEFRAKAS